MTKSTITEDTTQPDPRGAAGIIVGNRVYSRTTAVMYRCRIKICRAARRVDFATTTTVNYYASHDHAHGTTSQGRKTTSVVYKNDVVGSARNFIPPIYCECQPGPDARGERLFMPSMSGKVIEGIVAEEVTCDSRCTGAVGHKCVCSCGGDNHGHSACAVLKVKEVA